MQVLCPQLLHTEPALGTRMMLKWCSLEADLDAAEAVLDAADEEDKAVAGAEEGWVGTCPALPLPAWVSLSRHGSSCLDALELQQV
jgi:hypothetical protein